ncbi:MAG: hypothetical protein LLG04_06530 [Parachlamydia sp.]|nr:hypothetical protein [Parachlamydia sp.]
MEFFLLLVSLTSGAIVGHAASMQEQSLGPVGNIVSGLIGGGLGWILLEWLGWYTGEAALLGWQISALLGYMVTGAVTGGLAVILAALGKKLI